MVVVLENVYKYEAIKSKKQINKKTSLFHLKQLLVLFILT